MTKPRIGTLEEKQCTRCKRVLPVASFSKARNMKDGLYPRCRECHRKYYLANKNKIRIRELKSRYGLTLDEYLQLERAQCNACAICGVAQKGSRHLAVDHHHATGKVRGLLCQTCNPMIGLAKETPWILEAAMQYLNRNAS